MARILDTISNIRPHGSYGHDVDIAVEVLGHGDMSVDSMWIKWNGYLDWVNSTHTVHKCPEGLTGFGCRFDYDQGRLDELAEASEGKISR